MTRRIAVLLAVIFAFSALAGEPPEPSITPSTGPSSGGTEVTITGSFSSFFPYWVYFGDVPAATTTRIDSTTLKATTPAHLPGTVAIKIFEYDIFLSTDLTFTFTGDVPEQAYTRILLPLFIGDTPGAFGTVFRTDLWAIAKRSPVQIFGVEVECSIICVPGVPAEIPTEEGVYITQNGTPARFAYVPREQVKDLSMTLLAYERASGELETLPVVRFDEAADTQIALPSVPLSPTRRATLRIYAAQPATVTVRVGRAEITEETIQLAPGRNMFEPAYAAWSNFPDDEPEVDVRLSSDVPVWGMVTLTNNSTNTITAIAPQP